MPTGYTAGIIDGKITNFSDFAKLCMRNFGATMHLRDEPLNAPYKPREISSYHDEKLKEAKFELTYLSELSDEQIIAKRKGEIEDEISRLNKYITECRVNKMRLENILSVATKWNPPTPEHSGIKEFMVQQLTDTITADADEAYWDDKKKELENELLFLKPSVLRKTYIDKCNWSVDYHAKELGAEILRVNNSNKWVEVFLQSLP